MITTFSGGSFVRKVSSTFLPVKDNYQAVVGYILHKYMASDGVHI